MHTPGGSMVTSAAVDADTDTDLDAGQLWAALARSREHCDPRVLAAAEDEVFRHYVPLALAWPASGRPAGRPWMPNAPPNSAWPRRCCGGIPLVVRGSRRTARAVIATKLRRASTGTARHERRQQRVEGSIPGILFALA